MNVHSAIQRYVFKIHSSRIIRENRDLTLTINQARENKELIALHDSQLMRFIDELNGDPNPQARIFEIRARIKMLQKEKDISVSRPEIKKLYEELDKYQFKKDYICVVMDDEKDYLQLYKNGFKVNNITYGRLLGTTGGIKSNTIVFVNKKLLPELKLRIANGRNPSKQFAPAKLEAYNSLVCSSSVPVSMPHGIAVVHDCITHFTADVIELDDNELEQPSMKYVKNKKISLNDSDGYGLAMPQLMERWGKETGKNYILPGCVIRNSFCKGCVFPVDFQKFAAEHHIKNIIDVWGNSYPIKNIELILTESMLKLWDSYSSIEDYLNNCKKNHYTFSITKSSDAELENVRTMNYQFLQSYDFTDSQIDELTAPTINEIKEILQSDYRKTILYTKGVGLNEKTIQNLDSSFATALMIEPKMINDPYVQSKLRSMAQKRIDDAKIGVLKVPANYSLVSGDPYSLCQSMFGLTVTGLLNAGQVYSKYWIDKGVDTIVSFRAPMTSHNNIRRLKVVHNKEMDEFYKYMTTPTIFNSWDTCADAMNGFDKDGDCVINTSLPLLVNNTKNLPAIVCIQHNAPKCVPTEDDIVLSNIRCFGNPVGEVTNKVTSMFEVRARYKKGSREYRILDYRIKCGQLYQQNAIDKTKGIKAKNMPEKWYRQPLNKANGRHDSIMNKNDWLNSKIAVDKKPYFMRYIYPAEQKGLNKYLKANNEKCIMLFRITFDELLAKQNRTNEEENFIQAYYRGLPMGTAPCTVNKICRKIETVFDNNFSFNNDVCKNPFFDYSILKCNVEYSKQLFNKIKKLYDDYKKELSQYIKYAKSERVKPDEYQMQKYIFKEHFKRKCLEQCPNEEYLCDIILDLCYPNSKSSKQFAWDICGDIFIKNLLKKNNYRITYPTLDENGDIEFNGQHFSMQTTQINDYAIA